MKPVSCIGLIFLVLTSGTLAEVMSFSDNFDRYETGGLPTVSTGWESGIWGNDFQVVDAAGDHVVQDNGANHKSMAVVASSAFNLDAGQDLVINNSFTSASGNWLHGVVFNFTKTTVFNLYTVYMTRNGAAGNILVNIDKWVDSNNAGSGATTLLSVDTGLAASFLNSDGTMTVTYNAGLQKIGVDVAMQSGLSISTNVVDSTFSSGQAGIFASSSSGYVVNEFQVSSIPEPSTLGLVSGFGVLLILLRCRLYK